MVVQERRPSTTGADAMKYRQIFSYRGQVFPAFTIKIGDGDEERTISVPEGKRSEPHLVEECTQRCIRCGLTEIQIHARRSRCVLEPAQERPLGSDGPLPFPWVRAVNGERVRGL
jgi:hypothetical protein